MSTEPRDRGLRLFLDTADPADWDRLLPLGIFTGVTTNPLLLAQAGLPCTLAQLFALAQAAAERGCREIHLQTWGAGLDQMVANGCELARAAELGPRVCVKVPATAAGLQAASVLIGQSVPVTLTAVFQPGQVMAAAAVGAAYAAPYLGRLDDAGRDGMAVIGQMRDVLTGVGSGTRLLVASVRRPEQAVELAAGGLDTFTLSPPVAAALCADELTAAATEAFAQAARRHMQSES